MAPIALYPGVSIGSPQPDTCARLRTAGCPRHSLERGSQLPARLAHIDHPSLLVSLLGDSASAPFQAFMLHGIGDKVVRTQQ